MRQKHFVVVLANLVVALVVGVFVSAPARAGTASVVDPGGTVAGKTVGQWTADWWNWATSAPKGQDALTDTTGANANVNQSGPVFFVAGQPNDATDPVERSFKVPGGKYLLFPLVNTIVANGPDPLFSDTPSEADAIIGQHVDVKSLFASIDGQDIANLGSHREKSPLNFSVTMVDNSVTGFPAGTYTDANSDGYWLMVKPLSAGDHTLHFGGTLGAIEIAPGFSTPVLNVDVTDHVSVSGASAVPLPPQVFPALGLLGLVVLAGVRSSSSVRRA